MQRLVQGTKQEAENNHLGLTVPYAVFPPTGVLLGGIPWALLLLYMEFHRDSET